MEMDDPDLTVDQLADHLASLGYADIDVYAKADGWFLDASNGKQAGTPGHQSTVAYAPTILAAFRVAIADVT